MRRTLAAAGLIAAILAFWLDDANAEFKGSASYPPALLMAGKLSGVNMNSTADQAIQIAAPTAKWQINSIVACNPSISLTTAVGGVYSAASKGGVAIVASSQAYSGLTTNAVDTAGSCLILAAAQTTYFDVSTLYVSLTTPQGATATADFYVYIRPLY